jgi:hypothetical protein
MNRMTRSSFFVLALLAAVGTVAVGTAGCDYLSYDESTTYTSEEVFTEYARAKQFLIGVYGKVRTSPSDYGGQLGQVGGALRAAGSDIAEAQRSQNPLQDINDGTWSPLQLVDPWWGQSYSGIRLANTFLEKADSTAFEDEQFNEDFGQRIEEFKRFSAEARFLRAYFHWKLAKRYGAVPIVTQSLEPGAANSQEPSSFDEVIEFIVAECEAVMSKLPADYETTFSRETGRATRGAAMALKSSVLLYAASPLHNPEGDRDEWIRAARAAKAIIDSSDSPTSPIDYSLASRYGGIDNNFAGPELIWERREGERNTFEAANFPPSFEGTTRNATWPTQNLVSAYDMQLTGKDIDASDSGYDPENPYEGRDPRLAATVITNASQFKGETINIYGGDSDEGATETGYYLRKNVIESIIINPENENSQDRMGIIFRYGGILLDYAEAMNEAYGPEQTAPAEGLDMTALEAINEIRLRAPIKPFEPGALSQSEFRDQVRQERMVELAFENNRFWDLRRWKIGPSTTTIRKMEITQNDDGSFTYDKTLLEERAWRDAFYFYPIPQSELFKNSALTQNPGW